MREDIIESCRSGRIQQGELFPTVRDLARQYGLSVNLASEVVQSLVAEGVLHAKPGAGTIAGSPRPASGGTYLFLLPEDANREYTLAGHIGTVQRNFEVAIAQLGGACLTLEAAQARQYSVAGQLPQIAGVFAINPAEFNGLSFGSDIPRACFDEPVASEPELNLDLVHFDDFKGGQQATQHLLAAGYESIAFLAMHSPHSPGVFSWSAEREKGWREAMTGAGKRDESMVCHPLQTPTLQEPREESLPFGDQMEAAREAVVPLLSLIREGRVTAVVAANLYAARSLFAALQQSPIAPRLWPAVVCFDSFDGLDNHVVSALNLPWDEIGKAGAQLLWERNVGRLRGPGTVRLVPMQLIPRLTCRRDWTTASSLVMPYLESLALPRKETELSTVA
jgi:hypothetical protein